MEPISTGCGRTEELFDPSGHLLGHLNGANGVWWEEYVDFGGRLLWYYTQATNTSRYFHVNALGSLGLATDQTGAAVEEMLYYPFGVRWQNTTGFGWDEKFAQFPQRDDDIQMYEATFREYNPGLGRWMSPDKLAGNVMNPQSLDRYTYVLNNPVSNIDPLGLSCIHTDDGTTADNGDGKGCSEMNNNPQQVNVSGSGSGSGSRDTSSLGHLESLGSSSGASGSGAGDGAATTAYGILSHTNKERNRKVDECVSNFYKTGPGKFAQFFSPLALMPGWNRNWSNNLEVWAEAVMGKGGGTSVMSSGEEVVTINKITKVASPLEKVVGKLFRFVEDTAVPITGTATLMDIFAHQACTASQYPSAAGPGTVAF